MPWKKIARIALHQLGGLALVRNQNRRKFGVLMFHSFHEADRPNLDALCAHIARYYQPVSMSAIVDALNTRHSLPDNAIAVTVDDGYRSFYEHGHPVFWRHRIPTTIYAVSGFCQGELWLWPDQIDFGFRHTARGSMTAHLSGEALELDLGTPEKKSASQAKLTETLKNVPNEVRLAFLADFGRLAGVEIPAETPKAYAAMTWDEFREVATQGTEIGCHTDTHPILSRVSDPVQLKRETAGAKERMEGFLGFPVRHFCYPNGRLQDIGPAALQAVQDAGFESAVCTDVGLNDASVDRFRIHRSPMDSDINLEYGLELFAGLHM